MIDDYKQAMELMDMMNEHIPIPARATKAFVFSMRDKGIKIPTREDVHIDDVLYLGDVGGIGCALRLTQEQDTAIVASLTQLRVKSNHPLAKEIRAYQMARTRKLAQAGSTGVPYNITFKPRK